MRPLPLPPLPLLLPPLLLSLLLASAADAFAPDMMPEDEHPTCQQLRRSAALPFSFPSSSSSSSSSQFTGAAAGCRTLYLWGIQGSGSTYAWQVLKEVAAYASNLSDAFPRRPAGHHAGEPLSASASSASASLEPIHVMKGHYLNRMLKDAPAPPPPGSSSSSSSFSSATTAASFDTTRCIAGTYRDFRDIICSHARRGGIQQIHACRDCDATALEKSEAIIRVSPFTGQ